MTDMVERVAAIVREYDPTVGNETDRAIAIIAAMREPTKEMIARAVKTTCDHYDRPCDSGFLNAWQEAIDTALE